MAESDLESTNRLLRVIISVLIRAGEQQIPLKQQIEILSSAGLKPKEIAEILGKTPTHISKELSGIRKQKGQ